MGIDLHLGRMFFCLFLLLRFLFLPDLYFLDNLFFLFHLDRVGSFQVICIFAITLILDITIGANARCGSRTTFSIPSILKRIIILSS